MSEDISFSIIVPAYNEEEDLPKCLDALRNLEYDAYEVIVVDDASTDRTVEQVKEYGDGVKLLENEENLGVSGSRNRGIAEAEGEVLVILNADVVLEPDFLQQVAMHYVDGADFVVVDSPVINTDTPRGAFVQAKKEYADAKNIKRVWSEGWSCRKEALEAVGGFDDRFPGASGEDAALGFELDERFDRVVDKEIKAPHIAPTKMDEFRRQRFGRGRGRFYFQWLYEETPLWKMAIAGAAKLAVFFGLLPVTLPLLAAALVWRGITYYRFRERFLLPLIWLTFVDFWETRKGYYVHLFEEICREGVW